MGNVRMRAEMIDYGATNVKAALDDLDVSDLLELNARMDKIDAWKDTVEETELTGNPVTFNNALAVPAKSLVTTIEAIQDLHGYDKPWAGGAEKNKFNPNFTGVTGITPSVDSNGYLILTVSSAVSATFLKGQSIALKANTAYTLSCAGASSDVKVSLRNSDGSTIYASVEVDGGSSVYTPTEDITVYFYIRVETSAALTATLKPQLEEGTSATAFVRWANICPISGRTEARVDDVGKNQLPKYTNSSYINSGITFTQDENGVVDVDGTATATVLWRQLFNFKGGRYILSGGVSNNNIVGIQTAGSIYVAQSTASESAAFNLPAGQYYKVIRIGNGETVNHAKFYPMLRDASITDSTYKPYTASSVTVQLGTTVYGGEVNWDTGVATVTDAIVDMGSLEYRYVSDAGHELMLTTAALSNAEIVPSGSVANMICSMFKADSYDNIYQHTSDSIVAITPQGLISVYSSTMGTDASAFKTAVTGQAVCYKLATPTTIQLTPTQLQMLKGYNRVTIEDGIIEITAYTGAVWGGDET